MNLSIRKHIFRIRLWDVCLQKVSFSRTVHALLAICEEEIWIFTVLRAVIWMALSASSALPEAWKLQFLFMRLETQTFKVSLRSNGKVDVSKVAVFFGGGGHTRAAGCDLQGSMYDVINNITAEIEKQLTEEDNA